MFDKTQPNGSLSRRRALQIGLGGIAAAVAVADSPAAAAIAVETPLAAKPSIPGSGARILADLDKNIVEIHSGKVRGYRQGPVYTFKGIPYGAPTGGANRFAAPRPVEPWSGVRSCLSFGLKCPQGFGVLEPRASFNIDEDPFLLYRGFENTSQSENCLHLNLWTPGLTGKRAVMIFMHGGGFSGGSGNDLQSYDGTNLAAAHDVVVITHNHRLNVFGYLNLGGLGDSRFQDSANAGLLDLVALLQWVRDNAAQFGGDPSRVMIYGQSGGGGKVTSLLAMPAAKGLFHAAAIESGSVLRMSEPETSEKLARAVLDELSIGPNDLSRLSDVTTFNLVGAADRALAKFPRSNPLGGRISVRQAIPGWGPTHDGRLLPDQPFDPVAPAISADVPIIVGTNEHEFINGVDNPAVDTFSESDLNQKIGAMFGSAAPQIVAAYKRYYAGRSPFDVYAAIAASGTRRSARTQALRKSLLNRAHAYEYIYAWRTPVLSGRPGTFHSSEIAMVFDNAAFCNRYTGGGPEAIAVAHRMSSAWAALAKNGSPQHNEIPEWTPFDAKEKKNMHFDNICKVISDPEGEGLALIEAATANS